jgi:hypothetical protein
LTHEVENSGDGTSSQQSEVQTVTFNAGRGLGGTATLTYNDLYGQSWTTRPFNVGGDNVYRLEVSLSGSPTCDDDSGANNGAGANCDLQFTYNGNTARLQFHADGTYSAATAMSATTLRGALLPLFGGHADKPFVGKDRGNTVYVKRHSSTTSVKLSGAIVAGTRVTYDIVIPVDMSGHDDNGALGSAFTVAWVGSNAPTVNTAALNLYQLGDRSAEIESALTSLPNQVIPSVTVSKVDVTDVGTTSDGANGNVYSQSYTITFNNEANSGDQNMLTCNAAPCDDDGCINRGPGVSEVRYMHHDPESYGEGINFVNQGYFIMDIGTLAVETTPTLSAGTIRIMWDTGAGISSAEFAVVATAAEVQTALRTITGWEGVTVELWGNYASSLTVTTNHQFKVTFAAGYDDLGKSPTFKTLTSSDGAYAAPVPSTILGRLYDQRFSNSLWLGKITGYVSLDQGSGTVGTLKHVGIGGANAADVHAMPENGDIWVISKSNFGTGNGLGAPATLGTATSNVQATVNANQESATTITSAGLLGAGKNFAYLHEGATSVQTSDYFAVGATIEVLDTTWADATPGTPITGDAYNSNNLYRKFKVTSHLTNPFNREFAKLDSFPSDDNGLEPPSAASISDRPKYNLKITSNNATVHSYESIDATATKNEIQTILLGDGSQTGGTAAETGTFIWKLYLDGEESQDMTGASTEEEIAEEINGFSALSGPVTVKGYVKDSEDTNNPDSWVLFTVTFDEKDGDVAQMSAVYTSTGHVNVETRRNGWAIEGPVSLGLDTAQAGGLINVTAHEQCAFTVSGTDDGTYYMCYDGICGPSFTKVTTDAYADAMVTNIKDENGDSVLPGAVAITAAAGVIDGIYIVNMPMGKSCDGLEMRIHSVGTADKAITKTARKRNNGKQFKITRSFLQANLLAINMNGATTAVTCPTGNGNKCVTTQPFIDSLIVSEDTGCNARKDGTDDDSLPLNRVITAVATEGTGALTIGEITDVATNTCKTRIGRHVLSLDSMPEAADIVAIPCAAWDGSGASDTATTATTEAQCHALQDCGAGFGGGGSKQCVWTRQASTLLYTSPVGSCSVTETTKGTYESYECSNRGACDGKSGLCTCYEGYSGQSCQTQTVLV